MEQILGLVSISSTGTNSTSKLTAEYFPFKICDIPLPHCGSGLIYILLSIRTKYYTYIGECKCIIWLLSQYNSGHGSYSTAPAHRRPHAILGYICEFNGQ